MRTFKFKANEIETGEEIEANTHEIDIIADDGRTLFHLTLVDGVLKVHVGSIATHGDVMLDDALLVEPRSSNSINVHRKEYKQEFPV